MKPESTGQVNAEKLRKDLTETGRSIWLAGLGAVAQAGEEGREAFDRLVERGKKTEQRQFQTIDRTVARTSETMKDWSERLQGNLEDGMRGVLERVGLPTRRDLSRLSSRLDTLNQKVEKLQTERH